MSNRIRRIPSVLPLKDNSDRDRDSGYGKRTRISPSDIPVVLSSVHDGAAGDVDGLSGDIRRTVGGQKCDYLGHIVRRGQPSQRVQSSPTPNLLRTHLLVVSPIWAPAQVV